MYIVTYKTKVREDDWRDGYRDTSYDMYAVFTNKSDLESWIGTNYDKYMSDKRSVKIYHLGKEIQVTKQITYKYE